MRTTRSAPLAPALSRTYAIVGSLSTMPENTDAAHRRLPCARGLAPAAWLSEMSSPPYFDAYSEPLANTPAVPVHNGAYTHLISVCSERKQIRPFRSTSLSNCETTYKTARPAVLPPAEAAPFGRHGTAAIGLRRFKACGTTFISTGLAARDVHAPFGAHRRRPARIAQALAEPAMRFAPLPWRAPLASDGNAYGVCGQCAW